MGVFYADRAEAKRLQCVPFARDASKIKIRGNAWTWWGQAAKKYRRGSWPKPGAVMVMSKTRRLRYGHVAVVRSLLSSREIVVDHANWLNKGRIHRNSRVKDVSKNNDWSVVKVWYGPGNVWGRRNYPIYGFIYDDGKPAPHQKKTRFTQIASAKPVTLPPQKPVHLQQTPWVQTAPSSSVVISSESQMAAADSTKQPRQQQASLPERSPIGSMPTLPRKRPMRGDKRQDLKVLAVSLPKKRPVIDQADSDQRDLAQPQKQQAQAPVAQDPPASETPGKLAAVKEPVQVETAEAETTKSETVEKTLAFYAPQEETHLEARSLAVENQISTQRMKESQLAQQDRQENSPAPAARENPQKSPPPELQTQIAAIAPQAPPSFPDLPKQRPDVPQKEETTRKEKIVRRFVALPKPKPRNLQ